MQMVKEIQKDFWDNWIKSVMQEKILTDKWRKHKRNSQVGDVVLLKEETMASEHYRMGIIIGVLPGEDGRVRTVEVKYKNAGEKSFRRTTRSVHKVVTLVPVDFSSAAENPWVERAAEQEIEPALAKRPLRINVPKDIQEIVDIKKR